MEKHTPLIEEKWTLDTAVHPSLPHSQQITIRTDTTLKLPVAEIVIPDASAPHIRLDRQQAARLIAAAPELLALLQTICAKEESDSINRACIEELLKKHALPLIPYI